MFGSTQIWLLQNPLKMGKSKTSNITFEFAQEEITAKSGINFDNMSRGLSVNFCFSLTHYLTNFFLAWKFLFIKYIFFNNGNN